MIIEYVYQEPLVAWDFTQKREVVEGRNIPKEAFIEQLFYAYENVERMKAEFGDKIEVDLIQRNIQTGEYIIEFNIQSVVQNLTIPYSKKELKARL